MEDKLNYLYENDIETLLTRAKKEKIKTHSKLSLSIVQADLARAWGLSRFEARFGDYDEKYRSKHEIRRFDQMLCYDFLIEKEVATNYILPIYWGEAVSAIINEEKLDIDEILLFQKERFDKKYNYLDVLSINNQILQNLADYKISKEKYIEISKTDYFIFLEKMKQEYYYDALSASAIEEIFNFAKKYKYRGEAKRREIIAFLYHQLITNPQLREFLLSINSSPDRDELINNPEYNVSRIKFDRENRNIDEVDLWHIYPSFENEYMFGIGVEDFLGVTYETKTIPLQWQALLELIKNKSPELVNYTKRSLLWTLGMNELTLFKNFPNIPNFKIVKEIKKMMTNTSFYISRKIKACPSDKDSYLEPFKEIVIMYGTLENHTCYSIDELLGSFEYNPNEEYGSFRKPDHPSQSFDHEKIKEFVKFYHEQSYNDSPDLKNKLEELIDKISLIFSLESSPESIKKLKGEDKEKMIDVLNLLFEAGMYQRTWKGPGHPYPMKTSETAGSCLRDIESKMTPILTEALEKMESISVLSVRGIPSIFRGIPYTQSIMEFIRTTLGGNFCVGSGNEIMIATADYYLKLLGLEIEDFNINDFEYESTHR